MKPVLHSLQNPAKMQQKESQNNIFSEKQHKNSQQTTVKAISTIHEKDHTP
jgi:hypothetical protein